MVLTVSCAAGAHERCLTWSVFGPRIERCTCGCHDEAEKFTGVGADDPADADSALSED